MDTSNPNMNYMKIGLQIEFQFDYFEFHTSELRCHYVYCVLPNSIDVKNVQIIM